MPQIKETKLRNYWRSIEEKISSKELDSFIHNEFPEGTVEIAETMTRKKFLSLMGASMAMAGLVGCRKPVQKILPYINAPEVIIPGVPNYYASSMPFGLNSFGVVVETHEGRPTHIEGNELHPSSKGSVNAFVQSSILDLYDPDRLQKPLKNGVETSMDDFKTSLLLNAKSNYNTKGKNLAVLTNSFNSYTLKNMYDNFSNLYPKSNWVTYDSVSSENHISGLNPFFKNDTYATHNFNKANVILSLESDFLGNDLNSVHNQKTFSKNRRVLDKNDKMNRLYSVESNLTCTGMMADHRFKIKPSQVYTFIAELNNSLKRNGLSKLRLIKIDSSQFSDSKSKKFINVLSRDLLQNKSKSIISVGDDCDKIVHSIAYIINDALLNNNRTVDYHTLSHAKGSYSKEVEQLIDDIKNKRIETLLILDVDFYYLFSHYFKNDDEINSLLTDVEVIYLGTHNDKTSELADWSVPKSHYLECWSDSTSIDGSVAITQPMISPLYDSISINEVISIMNLEGSSSEIFKSDFEILKESWKKLLGQNFNKSWSKTIHDGILEGSTNQFKCIAVLPSSKALIRIYKDFGNKITDSQSNEIELRFASSSQVYDGRYINNYWLREASDPVTKISWENVALISYNMSKELHLNNSDIILINANNSSKRLPVWILPGLPDNTIILETGYGRKIKKTVDRNYIDEDVLGVNVSPLKDISLNFIGSATLSKTGDQTKIACTQDHHGLDFEKLAEDEVEKRLPELIRETNIEDFRKNENFVKDYDRKKHIPDENKDIPSLYPAYDYSEGPQWGMSIDLNLCTGCNACALACQSENNIPVVGKNQVYDGREMSWIRMDRYFKGDVDNPDFALQPVACLHCENAPCEQVCPVAATTHDEEGLNGMTYNRCIGTRYCANNCPYKVRRFNYYNYTYDTPEVIQMANNPDVTVRFRGVMEKCTYCVQRISAAKINAKNEKRELVDGDVKVACQSSCSMDAIAFGDITDSNSKVSKARSLDQDYSLLKELNTKPRTTYLAKFRNPHPDLVDLSSKSLIDHHDSGAHH